MLDLIQLDRCGSMSKSLGGVQYFVTFIDNHSWKTWVYLLNQKTKC